MISEDVMGRLWWTWGVKAIVLVLAAGGTGIAAAHSAYVWPPWWLAFLFWPTLVGGVTLALLTIWLVDYDRPAR